VVVEEEANDAQIEPWQMLTLHLDVVGHSTDSVPV
jgi:hypothetical protein